MSLKYLVKEVESHLFSFHLFILLMVLLELHVVDKILALRSRIKFYKPQLISYEDVISAFYCKGI